MPLERHLMDDLPEEPLLKHLAAITVIRQSDCSFWVAADEGGEPTGTFMVVCVIGPTCIADLQAALKVCMEKWEKEDEDESG